jgi:hypothetical protein
MKFIQYGTLVKSKCHTAYIYATLTMSTSIKTIDWLSNFIPLICLLCQ